MNTHLAHALPSRSITHLSSHALLLILHEQHRNKKLLQCKKYMQDKITQHLLVLARSVWVIMPGMPRCSLVTHIKHFDPHH